LQPSPLDPQVVAAEGRHSASGSVSAVIGAQVPSGAAVFDFTQATHAPLHAVSQHTPSTQAPLAHASADEHAAPSSQGAHGPPHVGAMIPAPLLPSWQPPPTPPVVVVLVEPGPTSSTAHPAES